MIAIYGFEESLNIQHGWSKVLISSLLMSPVKHAMVCIRIFRKLTLIAFGFHALLEATDLLWSNDAILTATDHQSRREPRFHLMGR